MKQYDVIIIGAGYVGLTFALMLKNIGLDVIVLEKRKLPDMGVEYPYLTVSDFLEPYLVRLVYPINKDKFFDGNLVPEVGDDLKGYILPIKNLFFEYFKTEDLTNISINKPKIETRKRLNSENFNQKWLLKCILIINFMFNNVYFVFFFHF